jgi:cytochrome c oxidase subunit III
VSEPVGIMRSATAQTAGAAADAARRRRSQPNGWWGMVLFLCGETTLFGTLLATYFYLDFDARRWPPAGIERPAVLVPLVAAGLLLTTSIPMFLAARAARGGSRRLTIGLIAVALAVQCGYLTWQIFLFRDDLLKFSPKGSAYGSIYFTILAVHHAHVAFGLLLDVAVIWQLLARGLTNYWLTAVRTTALYWHVVNVLAILVVLTQLSPSL